MSDLIWLDEADPQFPDTNTALDDPNGLLAVGGALTVKSILKAYTKGIFPWFSENQPILWWSPSPRMILDPSDIHCSRSLRKLSRKKLFTITVDTAFEEVIDHCADIERPDQEGTWITEDMREAYVALYNKGYAHSIEAWQDSHLVGGLYGIALGGVFFGESMFSLVSGASKMAFATLAQQLKAWQFTLIDCQIHTPYLESFGAREVERSQFEERLSSALNGFQFSECENIQNDEHSFSKKSRWGAWTQTEYGFGDQFSS